MLHIEKQFPCFFLATFGDNSFYFCPLFTQERSIDCKHHMTLAMDVDWDHGRLVTASWDYNVDMWDLKTGALESAPPKKGVHSGKLT